MSNNKSGTVAEKPDRGQLAQIGKQIDAIRSSYESSFKAAGNDYERACILACSLIDLRQAVKSYMPVLRQLQGSKLGFRTDKDRDRGYDESVVIDCAIEAVMRGARWTGNEFNIIAGGCYLTKEYWWRMVTQETAGLTDLDLNPGVPEFANGKCAVEFEASWKLDGKPQRMVRRIPILIRSGQSDDATLGKAEARMLKAIYKKVTGTPISDQDDDEPKVQAEPPKPAIAAPPTLAEGEVPDEEPEPFDWTSGAAGEREKVAATK